MNKFISHFLIVALLLPHLSWAQHYDDVTKELAEKEKKYAELIKEEASLRTRADDFSDRLDDIDGYTSVQYLKSLSGPKVGSTFAGLKNFHCSGGEGFATPPDCQNVTICKQVHQCPSFHSSPEVTELAKQLGLQLPYTNPKTMDEYDEIRNKLKRLYIAVKDKYYADRAEANAEKLKAEIEQLKSQKAQLDGQRSQLGQACETYKKKMTGKIHFEQAVHGIDGVMPVELSSEQVTKYTKALHRGMTQASALPPGKERIGLYRDLREMAEVLACESSPTQMRQDIDKLEAELAHSYKLSRNTNCATAASTDDDYNDFRGCLAGLLDTLPMAKNEFTSNAKQLSRELLKQEPAEVLDTVAKEQIAGALDNLAQIHALYDLHGPSAMSVCRGHNGKGGGKCGRFERHIENEAHGLIHGPNKPQREPIPNCGGNQMAQAQRRYKEVMQGLVAARQFSTDPKKRDEEFVHATQETIEKLGSEYPDIAPLMFSPNFVNQAEVDLDDMKMEFKPTSCDEIKNGLREALHENIRIIASPEARDVASESLARASQKTKRFLSDAWNSYARMNGLGGVASISGVPDYSEIDELYKDVPELQKYPKAQIHHLKSILKYRPELRERYMQMFEGNAAMICALFKGIEKDTIRDKIVEKETKFIKGVAKAVGTVVAISSFFVNPALGMVLTAAAFTTSGASNLGNISLLTNQLNDARNKQGQVLDHCIGNLAKQPDMASTSEEVIKKNCQEAVSAMQSAADLKDELKSAIKSAQFEAALYAAYMIKLAPQAMGGGHHAHHATEVVHAGEEILHNAPKVAGKVDIISRIQKLASTGWGKVAHGDNAYGVLKSVKAAYYASKTPYILNIFTKPIKNGYFYATLEEEVAKKQKEKGGALLSDAEVEVIKKTVKAKVDGMTEDQITRELNG